MLHNEDDGYAVHFINSRTKLRIPHEQIERYMNMDLPAGQSSKLQLKIVMLVGMSAIEKTHPYATRVNTISINKHILDSVLAELGVGPNLWRISHKYLAGAYKLVQIDSRDLMWFY